MNPRIDTEKTEKVIAVTLEKIRAEVDPQLLGQYHDLFKKKVSLFHRSKVAAYMLMLLEQGRGVRFVERDASGNRVAGRDGQTRQERSGPRRARPGAGRHSADSGGETAEPRNYPLADEDSKWLFFSAGRTRRVSPREILSLINMKTSIPKDDIGAIRIFDNYSFVQVRDTVTETIIEALNGHVFRGRPLTVNYAKSRKDEEAADLRPADLSQAGENQDDENGASEDSADYARDASADNMSADNASDDDASIAGLSSADESSDDESSDSDPRETSDNEGEDQPKGNDV